MADSQSCSGMPVAKLMGFTAPMEEASDAMTVGDDNAPVGALAHDGAGRAPALR
jgi:hypothetical protein